MSDEQQAHESKAWRDDFVAIASTMAEALRGRYPGWEGVTGADIRVDDHSGAGGGKAYKLTNSANPTAPTAALHILNPAVCTPEDPIVFDRERMAQEVLSEAGLTPIRVCEDLGKEWFVEEWAGTNLLQETVTLELVEEIARLVAGVHAIDPSWYDSIRDRQRNRTPALRDASDGCHIWWYAANPQLCLDPHSDALQRTWIASGPVPATEAGRRLVTVHGDITPPNIVRTSDGLRFIDMEICAANYAVADIAFFIGAMVFFGGLTNELEEAFVRAYLVASGLPASPADVFALRLDVERCKMATVHADTNAPWASLVSGTGLEYLETVYPRLAAIADRALADEKLAEEIVERGFERCGAITGIHSADGRPLIGTPVTVHRDMPKSPERAKMQINWDGTIQWSGARALALVLGVDDRGGVVLTNSLNGEERLELRVTDEQIPTTGLRAPASAPAPFRLAARHADESLVLSGLKSAYQGNELEYVRLGPNENALAVHVEPDGVIRLAGKPQQAFDCMRGSAGTRILLYHNHCGDSQKFVLNPDSTLSPIGNRDVVWGIGNGHLILVLKDDKRADRLMVPEEFAASFRVEGPGTLVEVEPPARAEGYLLELASHPGMALSAEAYEHREDVKRLVLVPTSEAVRFIVAAGHIRLAGSEAKISLGAPTLPE